MSAAIKISKKNQVNILLSLTILTYVGCASTITLKSTPPALVTLVNPRTGLAERDFGKTPVTISKADLFSESAFATVKLVRSGYDSHLVTLSSDLDIAEFLVLLKEANLNEEEELIATSNASQNPSKKESEFNTRAKVLFYYVMKIQKALAQGDFALASSSISSLSRTQVPKSILSVLRGNLEYVKGNKKAALKFYESSISEDPKQTDLIDVIRNIKASLE